MAVRPENAISVTTYEELGRFVAAFAEGHLNLLIIVGAAGLAKSRTVRSALGGDVCWIEGNATAFGMYMALWEHRDEFVVIDDVDSLYCDRSGVRLLKCLCQTEERKSLGWYSWAAALEKAEIPRNFSTSSRVVIIANDWKTLNQNVAAVQDRGHVVLFEPGPQEVHRQTATWFHDQEILGWFERQLPRIGEPSMRHYIRAAELKQAGLNWKQALVLKPENSRQQLVARLKGDPSYATEEARARAFVSRGAGCRATYFNWARKLKRAG